MHLSSISNALKMAIHYPFEMSSQIEYDDLINHIAIEIIDYSVFTENENKYNTGKKLFLSATKKVAGKVFNPIIKPFKLPANMLMMKWILAGIHQALVRYLINKEIFGREHSMAVAEACKGYEEILSKRFIDKLELAMVLVD